MKNALFILFLMSLLMTTPSRASDSDQNDLMVLDTDTFIKIATPDNKSEVIQLYKVVNDKISLVDAIQISEKTVNFKPLLQYRRLKIEEKDHF